MNMDDLKGALKAWGHATVNRFAFTKADRTTHILSKVRDHAPGRQADRALVGRDGHDRRTAMAKVANDLHKGLNMRCVPMWACDPIRAKNDAGQPQDHAEIAVDQGIPDDLRWLDAAIVRIGRQNAIRERVIRTEYTVNASQAVKARMVAEGYPGKFTLAMYRRELERALEVLSWECARAA